MPRVVIEQHEAAGFADQVDFGRWQPSHEFSGSATCAVDQTLHIGVRERHAQVATAIDASGASKSQVTQAARHVPSLPQFVPMRTARRSGKVATRRRRLCRAST